MSTETQEIVSICEALPDAKRSEVADFARFLLSRESDEEWERLLAASTPRPRLEAFLRDSAREGGEEPMEIDRL